ncbi:hypothetical protein BC835DRAFT_1308289 [Cytidiella melzeri]|nr:hypothetical protein BC835DRAFT_1308289 [Cytidiella melzeri]
MYETYYTEDWQAWQDSQLAYSELKLICPIKPTRYITSHVKYLRSRVLANGNIITSKDALAKYNLQRIKPCISDWESGRRYNISDVLKLVAAIQSLWPITESDIMRSLYGEPGEPYPNPRGIDSVPRSRWHGKRPLHKVLAKGVKRRTQLLAAPSFDLGQRTCRWPTGQLEKVFIKAVQQFKLMTGHDQTFETVRMVVIPTSAVSSTSHPYSNMSSLQYTLVTEKDAINTYGLSRSELQHIQAADQATAGGGPPVYHIWDVHCLQSKVEKACSNLRQTQRFDAYTSSTVPQTGRSIAREHAKEKYHELASVISSVVPPTRQELDMAKWSYFLGNPGRGDAR